MLTELLKQIDDAAAVAAAKKALLNEANAAQAAATTRYSDAVKAAAGAYAEAVSEVRTLQQQLAQEINGTIGQTDEPGRIR